MPPPPRKPMVNSPLIRLVISWGGGAWGVPLSFHDKARNIEQSHFLAPVRFCQQKKLLLIVNLP